MCGCVGCVGVGVWVCGCMGVWVCGCLGVWVCRHVDMCGDVGMGVWVCRHVDMCGHVGMGVWVCRCGAFACSGAFVFRVSCLSFALVVLDHSKPAFLNLNLNVL